MERREFMKLCAKLGLAATIDPYQFLSSSQSQKPWSKSKLREQILYDKEYFDAANRVVFTSKDQAYVSVLPKEGKELEVIIYAAEAGGNRISSGSASQIFNGSVNGPKDIALNPWRFGNSPEIQYQMAYREIGDRKSVV